MRILTQFRKNKRTKIVNMRKVVIVHLKTGTAHLHATF